MFKWDGTIHFGHIVTTLSVVGSVILLLLNYESRVTSNTVGVQNNEKSIEKVQEDIRYGFGDIQDSLNRIEDKLDNKVDK